MNTDFNIDDYLQKSMNSHEVQPGISSFDAVMKKLEKKRKRRFFMIFFFDVLGIALGAFFIFNYSSKDLITHNSRKHRNEDLIPDVKKEFAAKENLANKTSKFKKKSSFQKNANPKKEKGSSSSNNLKEPEINNYQISKTKSPIKNDISLQAVQTSDSEIKPIHIDSPHLDSVIRKEVGVIPSEQNALSDLIKDSINALLPAPVTVTLPLNSAQLPDSVPKNKTRHKFMLGLNVNPQLSSYQFSENKDRSAVYDANKGEPFSALYLENRKKQNSFKFNYAFGIKFGLSIKDKWELWFAGGLQRYTYTEKLYALATGLSNTLVGPSGIGYNSAVPQSAYEKGYKNFYRYVSYGLELNRIIKPNPFLRLKWGLGLKANQLIGARYIFVNAPDVYYLGYYSDKKNLSQWVYTINLNTGIIKDFSKLMQLRLCPGIFYSPSSMYNKTYVVKQRSYGMELECLLIYKFH